MTGYTVYLKTFILFLVPLIKALLGFRAGVVAGFKGQHGHHHCRPPSAFFVVRREKERANRTCMIYESWSIKFVSVEAALIYTAFGRGGT